MPHLAQLTFETDGAPLADSALIRTVFERAAASLEKEWGVEIPLPVTIVVLSNENFRALAEGPHDPALWKYCFLMCDPPANRVYLNTDLFTVVPHDAEAMIKHETAHIVLWHLVGNKDAYHSSYFLAEGTAGLDGATERLINKIKKEKIENIPDPLTLDSAARSKAAGGDTNREPFTEQLGELVIVSAVEFLRTRHGEKKVLEFYQHMRSEKSLEDVYGIVCGESLKKVFKEWEESIKTQIA